MQKLKNNNQIYLSGGGDKKQSLLLDKFLFKNIPKNGSLLYIPTALIDHALYSDTQEWIKSVLKFHKRLDIQITTATDISKFNIENLFNFDVIYIGGGNTWRLIHEFENLHFSELLIQYYKQGGNIYGGSAGAIILGKRLDTQDDANDINYNKLLGLNIVHNFSITCHYDTKLKNKHKKWALDKKLPLVCLPEDSGLVIEEDNVQCVGHTACTIISSTGILTNIIPGETFSLQNKKY